MGAKYPQSPQMRGEGRRSKQMIRFCIYICISHILRPWTPEYLFCGGDPAQISPRRIQRFLKTASYNERNSLDYLYYYNVNEFSYFEIEILF